jgi:AcrR family transcriptional regulator
VRKTKEQRIKQILKIGKQLLLQKGFTFTTKEIARKIGITETMIFHLFPGKKHIINAIYRQHFNAINTTASLPSKAHEKNCTEDLINYFFAFYRDAEISNTPEMLYLYAMEKSAYKPNAASFKTTSARLVQTLEDYFATGVDNRVFKPFKPDVMAEMIHNVFFHFYFFNTLLMRKKISDAELTKKITAFVEIFLAGIQNQVKRRRP